MEFHRPRRDFRPDISALSCHPQPRARPYYCYLRRAWDSSICCRRFSGPPGRRSALLDFALRASVTKAIILVVLFYVARHYGSAIGEECCRLDARLLHLRGDEHRHDGQLRKAFGPAVVPIFFGSWRPLPPCCVYLVWTVSLWELAPMPVMGTVSPRHRKRFRSCGS